MASVVNFDNNLFLPLCLTGGVLLATYLYKKHQRPQGFPPGPPSLPLVGSRPWLPRGKGGKEPDLVELFEVLRQKYGRIYSINFGSQWTVVLTDYESIKEACLTKGKDFAGRPFFPAEQYHRPFFPDIKGIVSGNYSEEWKKQRHLALTVMKELGYGRSIIEAKILEEADEMGQKFKTFNGKSFNVTRHIHDSVINIIFALLINKRFDYDDPQFLVLREAIDKSFDFFARDKDYRGVHLYLPPYKKFIHDMIKNYDIILDFINENISLRKEEMKGLDGPKCFIDSYLRLVAESEGEMQDWLIPHMEDFIHAGMETTATTITWAFYYMVKHPEVQRRVQQELDEVIGQGQRARLVDRAKLPYIEATLLEVFRLASTVPVALPHLTLRDTTVQGYTIPKNCEVYMFLWNVHHNPEVYPDPYSFKPERFLDESGQLVRNDQLIPFSTGRRTCLGEQLARQELFLFFSAILQDFTMMLPEGHTLPPARGEVVITHRPPAFEMQMQPR